MSKRKVLYICHNHPSVRPGGTEAYALELFEEMRGSAEFEPLLLAKAGPPLSAARQPHAGTPFSPIDGNNDQFFFHTDMKTFDLFYGTSRYKELYARDFRDFLEAYRPDIVHFQHTLFLGYDMIRQVKNTLPDARIVYTLHEFVPICNNNGQMIRTNQELCTKASPQRCNECYPNISPQAFFMRTRFIQSCFALVDLFLSPSRFLRQRYIEWGIPTHKIHFEPNGRRLLPPLPETPEDPLPRNRLGFFGQFSYFKGVNVLLTALKILGEENAVSPGRRQVVSLPSAPDPHATESKRPPGHLWLHGANLELQPGSFQNEFRALLEAVGKNVTLVGRYELADLPRLMKNIDWVVLPSVWWENSPLVIQEAFCYGRPVICSDIGGMAEKVEHGVNGLCFRVGDPVSLARTIREATSSPDRWETLRRGIPPVYDITQHVTCLSHIYRSLLEYSGINEPSCSGER